MKYLKGLALILLIVGSHAITFAQGAEGYYGTTYSMYLQRQGTDGHAFILHNAKFNSSTSTYQWVNGHPSFGARGLLFSYLTGITFFADNAATTTSGNFTPTARFFIGNNGNVGVGTTSPRGLFDVGGTGDIYLVNNPNGSSQTGYLPGHLFLSPYAGGDVTYLQARRLDGTGSASLRLRTLNNGTLTDAVHVASNGFVGIGTITPAAKLDVVSTDVWHLQLQNTSTGGINWKIGSSASNWDAGGGKLMITTSSSGNSSFVIDNQKRVGIGGILNPETKLHVADGIMSLDGSSPTIYTGSGTGELGRYLVVSNSPGTPTSSGLKAGGLLVADTYSYANPSKNDVVVKGYVGIGMPLTANPNDYRLAVNGKIGAKEVRVEKNSTPWPDYVFKKEYQLPNLLDVERFINTNNHLKDVPSATEVEKDGHDLGEMDAVLLKKIEELTLYIIQQQKEIEALKKAINSK